MTQDLNCFFHKFYIVFIKSSTDSSSCTFSLNCRSFLLDCLLCIGLLLILAWFFLLPNSIHFNFGSFILLSFLRLFLIPIFHLFQNFLDHSSMFLIRVSLEFHLISLSWLIIFLLRLFILALFSFSNDVG